jgi:hypothetical protein
LVFVPVNRELALQGQRRAEQIRQQAENGTGLSTMCPEKRDEVVSLGLKSIVSGTLTTCLLGAIVGVLS